MILPPIIEELGKNETLLALLDEVFVLGKTVQSGEVVFNFSLKCYS